MTPARSLARRLVLTGGLSMTACDEGCYWTDPNSPEPVGMRLGVAYPTEGGIFEVTLDADADAWPPTIEPFALDVIVAAQGDGPPTGVEIETPALEDGTLSAEQVPEVTAIDATRWRLDPIVLDAPGVWELPLRVDADDGGDRLVLRLRVE
jgi:hypothetical protein